MTECPVHGEIAPEMTVRFVRCAHFGGCWISLAEDLLNPGARRIVYVAPGPANSEVVFHGDDSPEPAWESALARMRAGDPPRPNWY